MPEILDAILKLLPLDQYSQFPVALMDVVPGDKVVPVIWDTYKDVIANHEKDIKIEMVERFAFYERSKRAFAIIATGEKALYGNIILRKGVV